jgi:hypothetical protein
MKIDSRIITVALFLLAQAIAGVIYLSKLSAEVERIGGVVAESIPPLQTESVQCQKAVHQQQLQLDQLKNLTEETSGLDVLSFRIDNLTDLLENLRQEDIAQREVMNEIMSQHESIFDMMQGNSQMQQKGGYGYDQ